MEQIRITVKLNAAEITYEEPFHGTDTFPCITRMTRTGKDDRPKSEQRSNSERLFEVISEIADKVVEMDKGLIAK